VQGNKIKEFLFLIHAFINNPSREIFDMLRGHEALAYMLTMIDIDSVLQLTEDVHDEAIWFNTMRQMCESAQQNDMPMALLYAVQLQSALSTISDQHAEEKNVS